MLKDMLAFACLMDSIGLCTFDKPVHSRFIVSVIDAYDDILESARSSSHLCVV
jgi:hypothetical protein